MLLSAETRKKHLKSSHGKDASFNSAALPPTVLGTSSCLWLLLFAEIPAVVLKLSLFLGEVVEVNCQGTHNSVKYWWYQLLNREFVFIALTLSHNRRKNNNFNHLGIFFCYNIPPVFLSIFLSSFRLLHRIKVMIVLEYYIM
jgi:hypothetical protein